MPDRRRSAMAVLMAASVFALPTSLLAAQEEKETTSAPRNTTASEAQAGLLKAAQRRTPQFLFAGPSRFAIGSASRQVSNVSAARQYTEEELREIRAAQLRLVREVGAGPSANPSGGVVLSHPTLGRIIVSRPGPISPGTGGPSGKPTLPNPGSSAGPSHLGDPGTSEPKGGSGSAGEPGDFPVLRPGSGFSGATPQPPAVGHSGLRGYDAKAIARWDVVPYQDFDGLFHIGVVAFHMNGIDRVEFSVEGGPWTPVTEMKLNPRTGVWEYTATLDAQDYADGLVEVRARVFPKSAGEVRVLAGDIVGTASDGVFSMFLHANAADSLVRKATYVSPRGNDDTGDGTRERPYRTIGHAAFASSDDRDASGATVYLLPGDYEFGPYSYGKRFRSNTSWLTIEAAPGVSRDQVRIIGSSSSDGLKTDMIRLKNLTIAPRREAAPINAASRPVARLWLDGCRLQGLGSTSSLAWWSGFEQTYCTDLHVSDNRDGLNGLLVRNVLIEDIGSDAFSNARFVVNATVRNIDRGGVDFHPDVYQLYGPTETFENLIVYGLEAYDAKSQGIFARGLQGVKDSAFVNVLIELTDPIMLSQWRSPVTDHVLFWHVTHLNKPFWFRLDASRGIADSTLHNVSFVGSIFESILDEAGIIPNGFFDHVHDIRGTSGIIGVDITTGDPGFKNPAEDDYSLLPSSRLRNRVDPHSRRYKVWDDQGQEVSPANLGAW